MRGEHHWDCLISLMEQEGSLLDDFADASRGLRDGLHAKDWPTLERALKDMDSFSLELELLEKERAAVTEKIVDGQGGLESQVAALPMDVRSRFHQAKSRLKAQLVILQSRTRGLAGYADSRARLGREIMEELVPSVRGRMYDKKGRSASGGRDPIVLSHHR